jgi:hypothetical protein
MKTLLIYLAGVATPFLVGAAVYAVWVLTWGFSTFRRPKSHEKDIPTP